MERKPLSETRVSRKRRLFQAALLATTCLSAIVLVPKPARAQTTSIPAGTTPQGGTVAAGSATIQQAPGSTTINQASQRAILDWQSFSVGSAAQVQFNQPNSTAIALNRVVTPTPSVIAGQITANGQIILVNQSGVVFTKGSQVNAESIVVSTSNIADKDFLAGNMNFSGPPNPGAKIINDGNITVKDAGLVGLVAPQVANNGMITARLGSVVLAGASAFTLDLYGDQLISLDVTQAVRDVDVGGQQVAALVTNSGLIIADGGSVTLTAQDADALVTQLITAGGTLRANTLGTKTGSISITGVGGDITIAGNLLAQGTKSGQTGGAVAALATGQVSVAATTVIDASGAGGGGVVALGTDLARASQGAADTAAPRAGETEVAAGAVIKADATQSGKGGTVVLLSSGHTGFAGTISVQGGSLSGAGGLVEISSGNVISLGGTVIDTALNGAPGEILLDPATLVVGPGTPAAGSLAVGGTTLFGTDSSTTSYILPSSLDSLAGSIVLEASSLISVNDALDFTNASNVALSSGGDITISAGITVASGMLEASSAGTLDVNAPLSASNIALIDTGSDINITEPVSADNGTIELISDDFSFSGFGTVYAPGGLIEIAPPVSEFGALDVTPSFLQFLQAGTLAIGTAGTYSTSDLDLSGNFSYAGSLVFDPTALFDQQSGSISAASFTIASPDILISGSIITPGELLLEGSSEVALLGRANAGTLVYQSGDFLESGSNAAIGAGLLTGTGALTLASANNSITSLGTLSGGTVSLMLDDAAALEVTSLVSAGTITLNDSNAGGIAFAGTGTLSTGAGSHITLLTDSLAASSGALISSGTLILAPHTSGRVIELGGSDSGALDIDSDILGAAQTAVLQIGTGGSGIEITSSVTPTAATVLLNGNGITFGADFDLPGDLLLASSNGVVETGDAALTVGTLASTGAIAGNVALGDSGNNISTLSNFATAGTFALGTSGGLDVTGTVAAGAITLAASQLEISGSLDATAELALGIFGNITESDAAFISAGTLTSGGVADGAVSLGAGGNTFTSLGDFSASSLLLVDTAALNVTGAVSASTMTLAAPGIALNGAVSIAGLLALESSAGITQSAAFTAGTLASGPGLDEADVFLDSSGNAIGTLGNFSTAVDLSLNDAGALVIAGSVSANYIDIDAANIEQTAGIISSASDIVLSSNTDIDLYGNVTGSELELYAGGNINETGLVGDSAQTGTIITGLLTGSAGGNVTLGNASDNNIGSLGAFYAVDFTLLNSGPLNITGPVEVDNGTLGLETGVLLVSGLLSASNTLSLGGAAPGDLPSIYNNSTIAANVLELDAGAFTNGPPLSYTVNEDDEVHADFTAYTSGGVVDANILTGTVSGGDADFGGTLNQISTLGPFSALDGAGITLADASELTVSGQVYARNISLSGVAYESSYILIAGQVSAAAGGTISLLGDGVRLTGGSSLSSPSGRVIIAPYHPGYSFYFGGELLNISAQVLQFGIGEAGVGTGGASTFNVGTLLLDGTTIGFFGALDIPGLLELETPGPVFQTGGGGITAGTLASLGEIGGHVDLDEAPNTVGTLGGLSAAGYLMFSNTAPLAVSGPVAAAYVEITAPGITVPGIINAPSIMLEDDSGAGISLSGALDAAQVLALCSTGNIIESAAGTLVAGTLTSNGEMDGNVSLAGSGNQITYLGGFYTANDFSLDGGANLTIGALTAANATLAAETMTFAGAVSLGNALALVSGSNIVQTSAYITAPTLTSAGATVDGDVRLTQASNAIGTLGAFNAAGTLELDVAGALEVTGPVNADAISLNAEGIHLDGNLSGNVLALSSAGSVVQDAGTLGVATLTSGGQTNLGDTVLEQSGNAIGTLANFSDTGNITLANAITLGVAGATVTGNLTLDTAGLAFTGSNAVGGQLAFDVSGDVSQPSGGISAPLLTGSAGQLDLHGQNAITTLGAFTANTLLELHDTNALDVLGPLAAPTIKLSASPLELLASLNSTLLVLDSGSNVDQISGQINAATISTGSGSIAGNATLDAASNAFGALDQFTDPGAADVTTTDPLSLSRVYVGTLTVHAPSLDFTGDVTVPGTLDIIIPGLVTQDGGVITAGLLTGSAEQLDLSGNNDISSLGAFATSGPISLSNAGALTISTVLDAPEINISAATLAILGTLISPLISLDADELTLGGLIDASTALSLEGGNIEELPGGRIITPLLQTAGTGIANASLGNSANEITALGSFTASGALWVAGLNGTTGPVAAGNATLTSPGAFTVTGGFAAGNATLSGTSIALDGTENVNHDLDLVTPGIITEHTGLSAGTLTGAAGSLATFASADIGTLGSFVLGDSLFELTNTAAIVIDGAVVANRVEITADGPLLLQGGTGGIYLTGTLAGALVSVPGALDSTLSGANILETGSFYINSGPDSALYNTTADLGTPDTAATLFLNATGSGGISLAQGSDGLQAPALDVVLDAGAGAVTGNIDAAHVEILDAGSTNLTGSIDGISGALAAQDATALSGASPDYLFNSCIIAEVTCTLPSAATFDAYTIETAETALAAAVQSSSGVVTVESFEAGDRKTVDFALVINPPSLDENRARKRRRLEGDVELPGIAGHDY